MSPARRRDVAAALVSMTAGVLLSALPHLLSWSRTGDPAWLPTVDDVFYLQIAATTNREGSRSLLDPALAEPRTVLYSSLPLLPGIRLARAAGLRPVDVGLAWRVWAGLAMGLSCFLLFRSLLPHSWAALGAALLLMGDAGMIYAWLGVGHGKALAGLLPARLDQWRVINPSLSLPFFLLHLLCLRRALLEPTRRRLALAAAAFGLTFYAYFFYWTAACLALALGWALDAAGRKAYLLVAAGGVLVGAPVLVSNLLLRAAGSEEALRRIVLHPVARFQGPILPKLAVALAAAGFVWVMRKRRDLLPLWAAAAAGLLLCNQRLLTGRGMGDEHWAYAWGPALSAMVLALGFEAVLRLGPRALAAACLICGAHFASALRLRALETDGAEAVRLTSEHRAYREQRSSAAPLPPKGVIAGSWDFVNQSAIAEDQRPLFSYTNLWSPAMGNEELAERMALNAFLSGASRAELLAERERLLLTADLGPIDLGAVFDRVSADPEAFLRRYRVESLALPAGARAPRAGRWTSRQDGPSWRIWSVTAPPTSRSS